MQRQVERNKACTCQMCGEMFEAVHYNAQYCSAKCRKRQQRRLESIGKSLEAVLAALEDLKKFHDTDGSNLAFEAICKIQRRTNGILDYWD